MAVAKACPVVTRVRAGQLEVLAFTHPLAGDQLVKGTIEPSESPSAAALRELHEESGLGQAVVVREVGTADLVDNSRSGAAALQRWHFVLCAVEGVLPEQWVHRTEDDGGHDFRFFWHPLMLEPADTWQPLFRDALAELRRRL